jgi:hypothetical protein
MRCGHLVAWDFNWQLVLGHWAGSHTAAAFTGGNIAAAEMQMLLT